MEKKKKVTLIEKILDKENKENVIEGEENTLEEGDSYVVIRLNFNKLYSDNYFTFLKDIISENPDLDVIIHQITILKDNLDTKRININKEEISAVAQVVTRIDKSLDFLDHQVAIILLQIHNFLKEYIKIH